MTGRDARFAGLFVLLALSAWAVLGWWSAGPYARYLDHPGWGDVATFGDLCSVVVVPAGVHALAWTLMLAAMMLPTTYPLLALFARITFARADHAALVARVVAGFLAVWMIFGLFAHLVDAGLRGVVAGSGWALTHGWVVSATVLAGAGLFQFSALKYRCLEACQAPFGFIASRWRGQAPEREAWRLGIDHGWFCLGCCWALMLVMFVVGVGSIGWMLVLAALMAAEKNLPWGRRLRTPLGMALLAWAGALVVMHL